MKKFFKALSVLMAAVIIAAALPVTVSAGSITDAKEGVVYIESTFVASSDNDLIFWDDDLGDEYGEDYRGISAYRYLFKGETVYMRGSGFAIGKEGGPAEYIVTNAHVVLDQTASGLSSIDTSGAVTYNSKRATEVSVYFSYGANEFMRAQIYMVDEAKDIAVLKLPQPTDKRTPLVICKSSDVNMNDSFAALGFPASSDAYMDNTSLAFDMNDITITRGGISRQSTDQTGRSVYQIDISISGGNSGGPLVNSKGEVVGINTFSVTNTSGVSENYAICIDELLALINRDVVNYTLSTESAGASNILVIIIIAAIAAIVVAVVVIAVIMTKNKKKSPVMAAAAAAGAYQAAIPSFAGATIIGMKGIMANRTFPINGNIIIGRNAQKCNIAYPVDTKGISAVHCQIRESGGRFEIIDRGSSNGTFLGSGQRLTPNVPTVLPDGTFFYLGSADQLFQIKY